jgi:choice-of-anchor B domain-containing protein
MRIGTSWVYCIAASLLALVAVSAQADNGKIRYVSGTGKDEGECLNKFRPCRTLHYASAKAGKADIVHVAEGHYAVQDTQQLAKLLTMNGRLKAGFNKSTGFSDRNASDKTFLVGVPVQLRERYEAAGFAVITDTKNLAAVDAPAPTREESQRMRTLAAHVTASEMSHAAAACVGGVAAGFPCDRVSLLSHFSLQQMQPASSRGADLWGYTDLNTGREYVVMGLSSGVAVVDVTDPQAPQQIAYTTGTPTTWREVTIYQRYDAAAKRWRAYAYITADNVNDFMTVLDLSGLPNSVEHVGYSAEFRAAHSNYMLNADYTYGIPESSADAQLVISGTSVVNGGNFRLYSVNNPRAPQFINRGTAGYTHDVASFAIADSRKAQCPNGAAADKCQVLADFNTNSIEFWDVTNPGAPSFLSSRNYTGVRYTHSGWFTEDGRYLFVHDELDEVELFFPTIVRVFDMANLSNPTLAGNWTDPSSTAIDHNGYVRGNRFYFSHYAKGLTVLDITTPTAPAQVGFFDTYPTSNQQSFIGAWGAYPFFPSGTVAIADINSGLYLLNNETLNGTAGTLRFTTSSINNREGQTVTLEVSRTGGSTGAVSVQLDLLHATTDANDVTISSQILNWAAGDTSNKSAILTLPVDALSENLELLLVRLKNPQGGATINYPDTVQVRIADVGAETRLRLLDSTVNVNEVRGQALIVVTRQGSAAGASSVTYTTQASGSYTAFTPQSGTLTWADGNTAAQTIVIPISNTLQPGQSGTFQVQLTSVGNANLENDSGAAVASVTATVNVYDPPPPPPPANPVPERRGGGPVDWTLLTALAAILAMRAKRRDDWFSLEGSRRRV